MSDKKFEVLWDDPIDRLICGCPMKLYRIRALKAFFTEALAFVKKGDLGGYVSSEKNLSQEGSSWINSCASVVNNAVVKDDALVSGNAIVKDNAVICEKALVSKDAVISDKARVCGKAAVAGCAEVSGAAIVRNMAHVADYAKIFGNAVVAGTATVLKKARISDSAYIYGNTLITDDAFVYGHSALKNMHIRDNSKICIEYELSASEDACITISGNSIIEGSENLISNVFNNELYSFELEDVIHSSASEGCSIVPICFNGEKEFLVKYNSSHGPMIYDSVNKKASIFENFKKESLKLFNVFIAGSSSIIQTIEPFIRWLEHYSSKDFPVFLDLAKRTLECGGNSKLSLKDVADYLELHLMSLPRLSVLYPTTALKERVIDLASCIIENGTIDIHSKEFLDFGNIIFVNDILCPTVLVNENVIPLKV